ncbi:DUF4302 domain-containing protein [Ferruginibacter lapsinanis]|uniref:DUF4302 domain-containing protein n=1 Tax=Ferruginibacter lapsinanis TaxID=563172 RepID=UPI001E380FF3|nr:DUF4302 domain-containing protein [Ferruginibacter lapsinanis]UEG48507.1 DUF4302 domain-containing protein [Ferruginibacter lapsinanis]
MKKFALFFIGITLLLSACKKETDYIFDQTPDERINAALAKYQAILTGAENGWKAYITVANDAKSVYGFYFKFTNTNRVSMVSDFDTTSAKTLQESSYRLRQQQQPTLIFDTYSYVHVLADPNEDNLGVVSNVNGGPVGQGLLSDFEFIFDRDSITTDTLKMVGKVNGAKLTLIRATKTEADFYTGGQWTNLVAKYISNFLTYYQRLTIDGISYDIRLDKQNRTITFSWLDGGNLQSHTTGFYNTTAGLVLISPVQNGSQTISSLNVDNWNASTQTLTIKSGDKTGEIKETILPVKIDTDAPNRWIQYVIDNDGYWAAWDGFHVNGVDDAYAINSLSKYYYLVYWPEYDPGNDFFAPIFLNADNTALTLKYGAAITHSIGTDGLIKFTLLGNYGSYPTTGPARLSRNQLVIPEGYYLVQTSLTTYDMVSAKDGKAWITWFF